MVLGDSMMEGYTIETPQRLSNLLERYTGVEHLNFATSQIFGPVQYLLLYEKFGRNFDHDVVLLGFLPYNDFTDSNFAIGQRAFYNRYRPYFVGSNGRYDLVHYNTAYFDASQSGRPSDFDPLLYLWNNSMAVRAMRRAWAVYRYRTVIDNQVVQAADPLTKWVRSYYYDYTLADLDITRYTLSRLIAAANGKPVVIATIPMKHDLENLRDRGPPPLPIWFRSMSEELGFTYVDLLPVLSAHPEEWSSYYHTCDNHWTAKANALAAKVLVPVIEEALQHAKTAATSH
jgi:hypothetical protein